MYVMSPTQIWFGIMGIIGLIRLGYVGSPWVESVVRGALSFRLSLVVGFHQIGDGDALRAVVLTNPVGVRQVDANRG